MQQACLLVGSRFVYRVSSKQSNLFLFETKQTEIRFVSVFQTCIETTKKTEFCRNKPKNLQKTFSIRGPSKPLFFFSVRTETTETDLFRFAFSLNQTNFFRFVLIFRTGIERTKTNRTYGMGN